MHDDQTEQPAGASSPPPIRDVIGGDVVQGDKVQGDKNVTIVQEKPRQKKPRLFLMIVVLTLLVLAGASIVTASGEWSDVRRSLEQAGILRPELEAAPEADGETLILVLPFEVSSGVIDTKIHREIARAIEEQRDQLTLARVRVVMLREGGLPASDQDAAKSIGQHYKATMMVWGSDTGARVEVSFLHLKEPAFDAADVTISETARSQIANGPAYVTFVTEELPRQLSFLALFALGQSAYSRGAYEPATRIIEQAVKQLEGMGELPEGSAAAYFRLGWLYQELGDDPRKAEAIYTEAIRLQPDYAAAYNNRGVARYDQDDNVGAIADYTEAIRLKPSFATAYNNRGAVRSEQGDKAGAIADYTEAIHLQPDFALAYNNRGARRSEQGDKAGAMADLTEAIRLQPDLAAAYFNRGNVRSAQGDKTGAIADYRRVLELSPLDSPDYEAIVTKLRELGVIDQHPYPYPPPSTPQPPPPSARHAAGAVRDGAGWAGAAGRGGRVGGVWVRGGGELVPMGSASFGVAEQVDDVLLGCGPLVQRGAVPLRDTVLGGEEAHGRSIGQGRVVGVPLRHLGARGG